MNFFKQNFISLFLITIFTGIVSYFFFAVIFSYIPVQPSEQDCLPEKTIYITTNGLHVDIIFPVKNLNSTLINKLDILYGTEYVSFGWGDRDFYIHTPEWSDLKLNIALKALFLKSESAMHVTCYPRSYPDWDKIILCRQQLKILNNYIEDSFKVCENGKFKKLVFPGYTDYDIFYEAKGSFSVFKTCNVWVNNALKETGVKTSVWSPFDFGILTHVRNQ